MPIGHLLEAIKASQAHTIHLVHGNGNWLAQLLLKEGKQGFAIKLPVKRLPELSGRGMKRLQRLFEDLDLVTQPSMKVRLIKDYLEQTPRKTWLGSFTFSKRRLSTRANPALLKSLVKDMTFWPADWIEKSQNR